MKQYYNISIYCNIYYCNAIQYGLKEILIYCTLLYIAMFVVLMLYILNHYTMKMTGPLKTWIIHFSFSCFYMVMQSVYCLLYCQNPYSDMKCLFTKIQSNIAIHLNTIRNTALTRIVSPLKQTELKWTELTSMKHHCYQHKSGNNTCNYLINHLCLL